jgi:hypothetical protein
MSITFSSIGGGIASLWQSVWNFARSCWSGAAQFLNNINSSISKIPVVGSTVAAAQRVMRRVALAAYSPIKAVGNTINTTPALAAAGAVPMVWRWTGTGMHKLLSLIGRLKNRAAARIEQATVIASPAFGVPVIGKPLLMATAACAAGASWINRKVSGNARHMASSLQHSSRTAASTFLGVMGIRFIAQRLGYAVAAMINPAMAMVAGATAAVVVHRRRVNKIKAAVAAWEEHQEDISNIIVAPKPEPVKAAAPAEQTQEDKPADDEVAPATEIIAAADEIAETPEEVAQVVLDELVEAPWVLPKARGQQIDRKLWVFPNDAQRDDIDLKAIRFNRRIAYIGDVTQGEPIGVDLAPSKGQRKLSKDERTKRIRLLIDAAQQWADKHADEAQEQTVEVKQLPSESEIIANVAAATV